MGWLVAVVDPLFFFALNSMHLQYIHIALVPGVVCYLSRMFTEPSQTQESQLLNHTLSKLPNIAPKNEGFQ